MDLIRLPFVVHGACRVEVDETVGLPPAMAGAAILARGCFGEDAKLWRGGPRYCAGVVTRLIAPDRWRFAFAARGVTGGKRLGEPETASPPKAGIYSTILRRTLVTKPGALSNGAVP